MSGRPSGSSQSSWDDPVTKPYAVVIALFVDRRMSADEFEAIFLRMYLKDDTRWQREVFDVLDSLFADVDDYCSDRRLREEAGGLAEEQLRERATAALGQLRRLTTAS